MSTGLEPKICVTKRQSFSKTIKFSRNLGFKSPNPLQKGVKHLVLISFRNNFGGYHTDTNMQMFWSDFG